MSELVDRIAGVIQRSFSGSYGGTLPIWACHAADAVLNELGLLKQYVAVAGDQAVIDTSYYREPIASIVNDAIENGDKFASVQTRLVTRLGPLDE